MTITSNWMVSRKDLADQFPLDTQSRGRDLTKAELVFAAALEEVFAKGIHEFSAVATALAKAGVEAPVSGGTDWDIAKLNAELEAINTSLDDAFKDHGYGA